MDQTTEQSKISYHEYQNIAQLVQAHVDEHDGQFRGMVAFGRLVTRGDTVDIDLLEIIEGWSGPRYWEFTRSTELPLRGLLRLYLLTPEEFENPEVIQHPEERRWVADLLRRARQGYEVITEVPSGYLRAVLEGDRACSATAPPPSGKGSLGGPLHLTHKG